MANKKHHFKVQGTKNTRDAEKRRHHEETKPNRRIPFSDREVAKTNSSLAEKYQVTWHAVQRYAERVLEISKYELDQTKTEMIAKMIRASLPDVIIDQAKYNIADNYYAVVNGDVVVTITKAK